jgi:hypothetical protein
VTDRNAAIFDVANDFHGVIAGCHDPAAAGARGHLLLDPDETLGPGQKENRPGLRGISALTTTPSCARIWSGGCRDELAVRCGQSHPT